MMLRKIFGKSAVVTTNTMAPASLSDEDIIQSILQGNREAYEGIMRRYNQRMYRVVRSIVKNDAAAMEIVQESHIKAYCKLADYQGVSSFRSWLYSIARNEALMHLRKFKREVDMTDATPPDSDSESRRILNAVHTSSTVEHALENKQLQKLINQYVDGLHDEFREVFVLRGIEQLSVRETAQILDVNEDTVKTRYFRAKKLMRQEIQNYLDAAGMNLYEFGGDHCDEIVVNVLKFIKKS